MLMGKGYSQYRLPMWEVVYATNPPKGNEVATHAEKFS